MKLGVFLPNWIGDVVMATPALRAMRKHLGPHARMYGVMRPYVGDVLTGTPWLDEQVLFAPKSPDRALRGLALVRRLRSLKLDAVVLLTNSLRTGFLAFLSGAKKRIGYARYGRGPLLTTRLQPPMRDSKLIKHPTVDYYLELAHALGCPAESPRLELATTAEDERSADLAWSQLKLRGDGRVIVLNSSGAFGAAKLWPVEHFASLARRVATQLDHDVLVLCGPSERDIAHKIVEEAKHPRVVSLAGHPLSIGLSKACVRRAALLVTTDSGPRHFAVAFGVPIVGLFGPTPPIWGDNPTAIETRLEVEGLGCLGCHKRVCPLGHHRCMRDLSVDRVFQAVVERLRPERRRTAA
jgi:heptosyltransferase-2